MALITFGCMVAGSYPTENPLATGGRVGRCSRGGSGAFIRSSGLPTPSTGGLHYTMLRFIVYTTTLLNTDTCHRKNRIHNFQEPALSKLPGARGDAAPLQCGHVARGASPCFTTSPSRPAAKVLGLRGLPFFHGVNRLSRQVVNQGEWCPP